MLWPWSHLYTVNLLGDLKNKPAFPADAQNLTVAIKNVKDLYCLFTDDVH